MDPMNKISYGTCEQFASLLSSIKRNVDDEPDASYEDPRVRAQAWALARELVTRLGYPLPDDPIDYAHSVGCLLGDLVQCAGVEPGASVS